MRAILIDAVERTVNEVEYDGLLESAYKMLRCELVDIVSLPGTESDLIVDDEGLLTSDGDDSPFFVLPNGWVFAGSGLVVGGCDDNGEVTSTTIDDSDVRNVVRFATRKQLRDEGINPEPGFGFMIIED